MQVNFQTFNIWRTKQTQNIKQKNFVVINPFAQSIKDEVQISFRANDYCSPKNFEIKNLKNLRCPVCGLIMMSEEQIASYINEVGNKKGQALIAALEKYEDESVVTGQMPKEEDENIGIYRPYKKQIVDIYKVLASENPNMNLLELTKLQAQRTINDLIAKQMIVIEELKAYIKSEYSEEKQAELLKRVKEYTEQIKGKKKEPFARQKFIFGMRKGLDEEHVAQMNAITTKMPTSENDINSFFVQYQRAESSKDIARQFVYQTRPTAEHIIPKAHGGAIVMLIIFAIAKIVITGEEQLLFMIGIERCQILYRDCKNM